jgi:hypothetical protein
VGQTRLWESHCPHLLELAFFSTTTSSRLFPSLHWCVRLLKGQTCRVLGRWHEAGLLSAYTADGLGDSQKSRLPAPKSNGAGETRPVSVGVGPLLISLWECCQPCPFPGERVGEKATTVLICPQS